MGKKTWTPYAAGCTMPAEVEALQMMMMMMMMMMMNMMMTMVIMIQQLLTMHYIASLHMHIR